MRHLPYLSFVIAFFVLAAAATAAVNPPGSPDDHFMCYKGRITRGAPKFATLDVTLTDSFESGKFTILKPRAVCPPAGKDGQGTKDDVTHLASYRIKPAKGEPKHVKQAGLVVINQFGETLLETVKPDRLLVPTAKKLDGPVAAPDDSQHGVDHYKCYKVKRSRGWRKIRDVPVSDQFEDRTYNLRRPLRLCTPVSGSDFPSGGTFDIKRSSGHLLCYAARRARGEAKHTKRQGVHLNNLIRPEQVDTVREEEFCVPSVVLRDPYECDVLNLAECFLPAPSSHFLVPAATPTGLRVNLPQSGIPPLNGPTLLVDPYNELDGFSPTFQIMMHFVGGVDPALSNASRLLPAGCCGQPSGPPWIDTRTYDGRSLDPDSPTVLLDAETGERILHFIEPDAHAAGNPERQALFLRPAVSLVPGRRYIVAARGLKRPDGSDVEPELQFVVLRDNLPTNIPTLEERRPYFEASIFPQLVAAGVAREDLLLAFDFTVRSEHQLTHQMLSMRDQAFAWLQQKEDTATQTFTVEDVDEFDCNAPGQAVWREVAGTFQAPLFLDGPPVSVGVQFMNVDANDDPVQSGTYDEVFTISIPCAALEAAGPTLHPLVLGHGLFGNGEGFVRGLGQELTDRMADAGIAADWTYILGATDWRGLSSQDLLWVGANIIGLGSSQLNNFPALPDRLRQGQLNTLVLARMMKRGLFNIDPAFQKPGGEGIFPGAGEEMFYFGASLGGIMGIMFAALTPDVERLNIDVGSINFSLLLQRSTQFGVFEVLLQGIGLTDPLQTALGLRLTHELWVTGEPAGYARHVTSDPLPGANAKKILMTVAWLDKQVTNHGSEIAARTLGLPSLQGSLLQGLQGMPDLSGPLDSAYVVYDSGAFDLFNPVGVPLLANLIPSSTCDPHGTRATIPASLQQLVTFLQPGGQVENFCSGICDADGPFENPEGSATHCVPQ